MHLTSLFLLAALFFPPAPGSEGLSDKLSPHRLQFKVQGHTFKVPYYRNYALGEKHAQVERAVVVIHGNGRSGESYFQTVLQAASKADGAEKSSLILAPQFLIEEDINEHKLDNTILFWTNNGWKVGDLSRSTTDHPRPAQLSSFAVIDHILERLANREHFPKLQKIVIAGHSAGGQFVNRYAAGGQAESKLQRLGIAIRHVVANPSSYLYMDDARRVKGTLDQFTVPQAKDCPKFNHYKYGLNALNPYMKETGTEKLRTQYGSREVVYLLGGNDTDINDEDLDKTCEALLQGENRLERGKIHYNYLSYYFKKIINKKHTLAIVPNVGHSAKKMFLSKEGVKYLFDYNGH